MTSAGELAAQQVESQHYRKSGSSPESSHTTTLSSNRTKASSHQTGSGQDCASSEDYILGKTSEISSGDGYEFGTVDSGGYFCQGRRELSADSATVKQKNLKNQVRSKNYSGVVVVGGGCDQHHPVVDSDGGWDMTDYQRSLSEGRLIDRLVKWRFERMVLSFGPEKSISLSG